MIFFKQAIKNIQFTFADLMKDGQRECLSKVYKYLKKINGLKIKSIRDMTSLNKSLNTFIFKFLHFGANIIVF